MVVHAVTPADWALSLDNLVKSCKFLKFSLTILGLT